MFYESFNFITLVYPPQRSCATHWSYDEFRYHDLSTCSITRGFSTFDETGCIKIDLDKENKATSAALGIVFAPIDPYGLG